MEGIVVGLSKPSVEGNPKPPRRGCNPRIELVPIDLLKPHEQVISEHVIELLEDISRRGILIKPVLVDEKTLVILDGHHRVEALKRLGAKLIPAVLVDYDDDNCVTVDSWRPDWVVTKNLVRSTALNGGLLPPKTSRHKTLFTIPDVNIPLSLLCRGD